MTDNYHFRIKSAFAPPAEADGFRVLVERMWPPELDREAAQIDLWFGDGAPSNRLRKYLNNNPQEWEQFCYWYVRELNKVDYAITELFQQATSRRITLLYVGDNAKQNSAVVVKAFLEGDVE